MFCCCCFLSCIFFVPTENTPWFILICRATKTDNFPFSSLSYIESVDILWFWVCWRQFIFRVHNFHSVEWVVCWQTWYRECLRTFYRAKNSMKRLFSPSTLHLKQRISLPYTTLRFDENENKCKINGIHYAMQTVHNVFNIDVFAPHKYVKNAILITPICWAFSKLEVMDDFGINCIFH